MKKIILLMAVCFTAINFYSQEVSDAVIFSEENLTGTARFRGLSGAFGALGGDMSAISINPASSAVFNRAHGSVSLSGYFTNDNSLYGNGLTASDNSSGKLNQIGGVFVFKNTNEASLFDRISVALNYDLTQNLNDEYFAFGETSNSVDSYFLNNADGVPLQLLQLQDNESVSDLYSFLGQTEGSAAQQAFLGFQGFIIEPDSDDPNNTSYFSTLGNGSFLQDYRYRSTGTNGKFAINVGTQLRNGLHLGATLNSHFINYERQTLLLETNDNAGSDINEIYFENNLQTFGSGFSAQVGAIYKVKDVLRLGLAFDTPTFYEISEESTQYLDTFSNENGEAIVNPRVINVFPDYQLRTPGKFTASAAVLFGNAGLLSLDYSYKDHSKTEYDSQFDGDFDVLNAQMENQLKAASTIRLGGEYRIQNATLRGGFRFSESPYENETTVGDLTGYSAGFGYNFGKIKLDLAYDVYEQDRAPQLYSTGLTNRVQIDRINSSFTATLSFSL